MIERWLTRETLMLAAALCVVGGTYAFFEIADEVSEGDTQRLDERIVTAFRRSDDPALPVGPDWFREAMMDATALGSPLVLGLATISAVGYFLLAKRPALTALTLAAVIGGTLLNLGFKYTIDRDRPTVVPHLREVTTPSFPSGHAMMSAIVYMTLGILMARVLPSKRLQTYCLGWGLLTPLLVGVSRVYLGVHYPTDVLAGWAAGLAWALGCWLVAEWLDQRRSVG